MKFNWHTKSNTLKGCYLSVLMVSLNFVSAQQLTSVDSVTLANGDVELRYNFDRKPITPKSFFLKDKSLLVVDFNATGMNEILRSRAVNNTAIKDVQNVYHNNKVRSTINVKGDISYSVKDTGQQIIVTLSSKDKYSTFQPVWGNSVQSNIDTIDIKQPLTKDVSFYRNSQGSGVVEVFLPNNKIQAQLVGEERDGIVIDLPGFTWNPSQVRRIVVTDFATPVSDIEVVNNNGSASVRVKIQSDYDYNTQQVGDKFQLVIKPKATRSGLTEKKGALGPRDVYTGELISVNFQDIQVRTLIQIIADFTGLNMVVSDSVNSNISISLRNVPWDQALDVVLRSKGLVKQQSGNVVFIMPASEFRQQAPELITEIIQVNNAKAEEIATVLTTNQGSGGEDNNQINRSNSTGISSYGSLTVDANQNLLIIRDTAEQMEIIHELMNNLDKPLRQVVIKAQIIATTDDFARSLGVNWGVSGTNKRFADWSVDGNDVEITPGSGAPDDMPLVPGRDSNIWGSGFGNFGLGDNVTSQLGLFILRRSFAVNLELQAMQQSGNGEVLSSPTLMTTDRQEAYINQGREIAYTSVSDNGTNTEFKDVVMELKVTPSITPDDKIIMDIHIKKDDPGGTLGDQLSIIKREIKTQATVNDGETVVLGGIYEVTTIEEARKVPFLGDLPFIGNLFKSNTSSNTKAELVIFLTPNIVR